MRGQVNRPARAPGAREAPEFARARQPEAAIFSRGARQKSGSHQAAAFGGRIGGVQQALVQRNAGFRRATGLDDEGHADKNRSLRQRRDGVGIAAQGLDRARRGGFARRGGVVHPFAQSRDGVGVSLVLVCAHSGATGAVGKGDAVRAGRAVQKREIAFHIELLLPACRFGDVANDPEREGVVARDHDLEARTHGPVIIFHIAPPSCPASCRAFTRRSSSRL